MLLMSVFGVTQARALASLGFCPGSFNLHMQATWLESPENAR